MATLEHIASEIDLALAPRQFQFRRRLTQLRRQKADPSFGTRLESLARQVNESVARRTARQATLPTVNYDTQLPVLDHRADIASAIQQHQVVIVCGETGSGKSTQLPKICLEMGRGVDGVIGLTQPRRLAARSIAARLADELDQSVGQAVGYKIRFADRTGPNTFVKLMTDGILLTETTSDRFLNQYDTIILDEAHERSLNVDFLLGYLRRLLPKRPELRCVITSATIDAARFSQHFSEHDGAPAPVIEVSGRNYPVELRYRPPEETEEQSEPDLPDQIVHALDELLRDQEGDILVFLPTERDIRETARVLGRRDRSESRRLDILPLYARLPATEQNRIFAAHSRRRVVLATNVAESSLTVPGIRAVIDTGTVRISRYSPRSKVQRLPIEAISQASADQRKGRCGRVGPGICVRLYAEEDFAGRDQYTTPEIRRTNLAAVILQTIAFKLGPIEEFPFLDPPRPEAIRDGYQTLFELGAIDHQKRLTTVGRELSRLPVDPRVGRMILAAEEENCLDEVLAIAAGLEVQDPKQRPPEKKDAADQRHAEFSHDSSDFLTLLNLWDLYHHWKHTLSRNQLRKACRQNFLSLNRLREWADIYRQLRQIVEQSGRKLQPRRNDYDAIHRALLAGLLSGIAYLSDANRYQGAGGNELYLWPGSTLFRHRPKWIMAAELVETNRRYCRVVARINPQWIESLASHLIKRSHSDPHWRGLSAMVFERVSLFSLPIVPRRRVPLGPIDPETARQLFIQHALVEEGLKQAKSHPAFGFLDHNRQLVREITVAATKHRRGDWIVGERELFEFYDQRLPDAVYDVPRLKRWLTQPPQHQAKPLWMQPEDLRDATTQAQQTQNFPDQLTLEQAEFPLKYRFTPGDQQDGVTVTVPQQALNQLPHQRIDWLVPGRLEEKVTALIRTLPKSIRRGLVPAPDTARRAAEQLAFGQGPLLPTLAKVLGQISGEPVPVDAFQIDRLPPHLVMNVRVVDQQGKTLAIDHDLDRLRSEFGSVAAGPTGQIADTAWQDQETTVWSFGDLPTEVNLTRGGLAVRAYPAILDRQDRVALRLVDTWDRAQQETRGGLRRLYFLAEKRSLLAQIAHLPRIEQIRLFAASMPGGGQVESRLAELLADRAFLGTEPLPRTETEYQARLQHAGPRIGSAVQEVAALALPLFETYQAAKLALEHATTTRWQAAAQDVQQQLSQLISERFLTSTPWQWLQHFPRYFRAIDYRLDKLRHGSQQRDQQALDQLRMWLDKYQDRAALHHERGIVDPQLVLFRWMLEEYRVSVFAQPLGTAVSVSDRKLEKQWAEVQG